MADILRFRQNITDRLAVPVIGTGFLRAAPGAETFLGKVVGRRFDPVIHQRPRDGMGAFALYGEPIDTADNLGGFLVDQPMVLVLRVFLVTVDGIASGVKSRLPLCLNGGLDLAGLIPQVPLVHNVQEGRKLVGTGVLAVHIVGDSNKMNPILPEIHLGIKAGLQVVAPDAGHILDQHRAHQAGFNISDQTFPVGAVKVTAAPTVIRIMDDIGIAVLCGIGFEVAFLVYNGVRVAREFIVAGETLIERRNFFFRLSGCHSGSFQTDGSFVALGIIPQFSSKSTVSFWIMCSSFSSIVCVA